MLEKIKKKSYDVEVLKLEAPKGIIRRRSRALLKVSGSGGSSSSSSSSNGCGDGPHIKAFISSSLQP